MNKKQRIVYKLVNEGKSIFITGAGGVGKSYMIEKIREIRDRRIFITALTGCASVIIKGTTLHSWSGVYPDKIHLTAREIVNSMYNKSKERWKITDTLVIDEVSMLSKDLFEKLNKIGQIIRGNKKIFGGIQLIFSGDFFQLPPIVTDITDENKFVFCSKLWNTVFGKTTIELTEVIRQKDEVFVSVLNKIRKGIIDEEVVSILESRLQQGVNEKIKPTQLLSMRYEVNNINNDHMFDLDDIKVHKWQTIQITGHKLNREIQQRNRIQWESNCQCDEKLFLAVGAQVVLLHNKLQEEYELVNGSRGVVESFTEEGDPVVKFKNITIEIEKHKWEFENYDNGMKYEIIQYPLKLAWALTIHKSQGMTLDHAIIDINNVFEEGQAYVALSRVKNLDGLYIKNMCPSKIRANEIVKQYYKRI